MPGIPDGVVDRHWEQLATILEQLTADVGVGTLLLAS